MIRRRAGWLLAATMALPLAGCAGGPEATDTASATTVADQLDGANEPATVEGEWVSFESEEGGFRVDLPAEPERSEQTVPSDIGPLQAVFFSLDVGTESGINIAYTDYPEAVLQLDPAVVLDAVVEGSTTNVSGSVESSEPLMVDGHPAVDYVIAVDGGSFRTRSILVGQRLYGIQRGGTQPDDATFARLADSFELLGS